MVGKRLFPAQMETRGPHVASVVFPRRTGAKAGRPDFQTSTQDTRSRVLPGFPPLSGFSFLYPQWPLAQPLFLHHVCGVCQAHDPSPTGLGHGLGFSRFGFLAQRWCTGCPTPSGPRCVHACSGAQSCLTLRDAMEPTELLCSWDAPGKNTGVDCHVLLQGIFLT